MNIMDSQMESLKPKPVRQDVYIPTDNSLITEILMETQPLEKIEKNLFGQYLKSQEPLLAGQPKRPLPKFLSKMEILEQQEKEGKIKANKVDFMALFEKMHQEYRMDFDSKLARYFHGLILSKDCEIYDIKCFDANIPPINSDKYSSEDYIQNCIVNHLALNITLQDQLREQEKEILRLNKEVLVLKYQIDNDPDYVRNLYKAYKLARSKKFDQARSEAAAKALKLKNEQKG